MNPLERDFFTDPERIRARLDDLDLVDPGALSYAPSFIIRGLNDLPLRFRRERGGRLDAAGVRS